MQSINQTQRIGKKIGEHMKVFLGGTCNNSSWRNVLIPQLRCDYFNPVVEDWTPECQSIELTERENADIVLYVITPLMMGVYSIAEVIDDSNKRPEKTVFCFLTSDRANASTLNFTLPQIKSLNAVAEMVKRNGGTHIEDFHSIATYLNELADKINHSTRGWK